MLFVFGECKLDVDRRELRRAGVVRPLEPKAFTVLVHLVTQRHRAVAKDELLATCWPGEFVTEAALTRCLKVIRQAVGDDGGRQHLIKTLRGHGYRFVATVAMGPPPLAEAPPLPDQAGPSAPALTAASASVPAPARLPTVAPPALNTGIPCPQCRTSNRAARQFCAACGHALWRPCLHCGFGNSPTEHFCGGCGRAVAAPVPVTTSARTGPPQAYTPVHLATQILASQQDIVGERKYATVLVAGIEGLPALRQVGAPEEVDDLLNRGFAQVVAEVHQVEGFITQVTPHGGIALFGVPLTCEDHVLRALHAALGMRRAFTAFAVALHQTHGVVLTLRLGVHTGPVVVSAMSPDLRLAYTAPGATVECATGLQQLSRDGSIVVSATVQQQAAGFFRFTAMGTHLLPELAEPVGVYTCDGVGSVTSRLAGALARQHTAFQGRTQELARLHACWTRVCQGAGQVVCLVGEAGMGKSRLAYECQQALGEVRWLTAQTLSYGRAMPYHAIIPLLRTVLGVEDTAVPAAQRQVIRTRLAAIDPTLAADAPLLASLLGVPLETESLPALAPDAQRWRLHHACLQVLQQQATDSPLGLLVEDGHWLDPSSQELLDLLVATLARRPILVLCTTRPGFQHPWADYTYFHQVAVAPLAEAETAALLHDLLRPYTASAALTALLRERTGGNPFFVEELVRALQAQGLLTLQGTMYEVAPEACGTLPASIQGLIQARLDRLPVAEKHLLQVAAVIGPKVSLSLLQDGVDVPEEVLDQGLTHLQAAELLYETHTGAVRTYTFKHALIQDTAYQSMLQSARRQYHQRIAQVLEARFPETVATQPELLAYHYTEAGLTEPAIAYWQRAGRRAYDRSAHLEAIEHLTKGLGILMTLPATPARARQEIGLQIALGASLLMSQGPSAPEVEATYARARTLCQGVGDVVQLFRVLFALSDIYINRAEHKTARELAEQLLDLAQRLQDPLSLLMAYYALGNTLGWLGEFALAREHLDQALALNTHQLHARSSAVPAIVARVASHCYAAFTLWVLGYPNQALGRGHEALTLAQALSHPYSVGVALHYAGWVH